MNIALVWNEAEARGDWQVSGGRLLTGHLLRSAVLISLFTDRRVDEPGAAGASDDPRGWWQDSFEAVPIGSRLWTLRRRKIADRAALVVEARDICQEALAWMIEAELVVALSIDVTLERPAASTVLRFLVRLQQPGGAVPLIRALWRVEGGERLH